MSPASIPDELRKTNAIFQDEVVKGRNVAALDRVYTRNARILPPGTDMVSGREQIKQFWQAALDSMKIAAVSLQSVDVEDLGDTRVEIGRAELTPEGSAQSITVKYVVVWKREDGAWKWHVDIWNPNS